MQRYFRFIVGCMVALTLLTGTAYADSVLPSGNPTGLPFTGNAAIDNKGELDIGSVENMLDKIKEQKTAGGSAAADNSTAASGSGTPNVQNVWVPNSNSYDIFLKLDGIEGSSVDSRHRNEIELISYSFNVAGNNKKTCEIKVIKIVDKASPKLMLGAASGELIKNATLTFRRAGRFSGDTGYSMQLEGIKVASFEHHPFSSDNVFIVEEVCFEVEKVSFKYDILKPDGSVGGNESKSWDFKTGREL